MGLSASASDVAVAEQPPTPAIEVRAAYRTFERTHRRSEPCAAPT